MQRTNIITERNGLSYVRFTIKFKDLTAAAASQAISLLVNPVPDAPQQAFAALFSIPAGGAVIGCKIVPTQSFTGGALSAMTVSVGTAANAALFASAFDVFQAPGDLVLQESGQFQSGSRLAQPVLVTFTATGDNVNACTRGFVDIYICFLNIPDVVS